MSYNESPKCPGPSKDSLQRELEYACEKYRGYDGTRTVPIRLWVLRRLADLLNEAAIVTVHDDGE